MKKEKTILILLILPLFLSTSFLHVDHKKNNFTSHEVEFTFTGNVALYGTPKDCGLFSPDTVTLKGLLSGNENFLANPKDYDPVVYSGVLHINIKMAVCNVKRVKGEDKFCIMTVSGNGPVLTELMIDTAAGYGYLKIDYDSTNSKLAKFGKFDKHVYGTCDPQEMKEEQDINVPNNTIAAIFNGLELPSLKNSPILLAGKKYTESGSNGTITVKVKN
jgi:hypothetical protein